ncbi:hypothetical protein [Vibrio crassostreae]|uniref:Uncharacterized protein n=1 Tax=Vibrio crassostreae TaxID=246167 RepID=A0ABM9QPV8_9VIBR|nr:hypothetical protein [Vibrio crassostreae]ROS70578.1 hypothetical protein EDB73_101254 [Vibrio crassostreae]TCL30541.1 hypothetical protein EDB52_101828 [Vibrio crassostreae]TCT53372.1 hypothetical protein EDB39_101438 [Vibrio crassostreae]TCT57658.1 hypothetical protein EDB40_108129 [Vibrio crassostreae]TCV57685.1 hypothetical protein EDB74_11978 [Vibrio crassostreae]
MGTIIGLVILAAIDWYLVRKTGLHIHQCISKKYATHLSEKGNKK